LQNINSHIFVIEANDNIIVTGSIFLENKIIHNFKSVGHIEDIVVDKNYRNMKLGKKMIDYLINFGYNNNCYKIILDCSVENVEFYKKCGFINNNMGMALYFS
jgi:glucosamine-phosphate N-acetyltransferase